MLITHDVQLDIAIGRSRDETAWKNKKLLWSKFLARIKDTTRTKETLTEYTSFKKSKQDDIKDVGGFVGGYLAGGKRQRGSVMHRQLITLDIDFATPDADIWAMFCMMYDCTAAVYSTHKHSPAAPRLRLIIPLDRPVVSDEYIAIARSIAGTLNIELFDHTGFQPFRLMYWPSSSIDAEYVFHFTDGPLLSADDILSGYANWSDTSSWPVSSREKAATHDSLKEQGDPLLKKGLIGAFCRTYNIHEAIEAYLPDAYTLCDGIEGRYTYAEGSTAAGLIVYDDKFAYSHHGSDPAGGKLCNAFDLVRLHLHGLKDKDTDADTPVTKLGSYTAMMDTVAADRKVVKRLGIERIRAAQEAFKGIAGPDDTSAGAKGKTPVVGSLYVSGDGLLQLPGDDEVGGYDLPVLGGIDPGQDISGDDFDIFDTTATEWLGDMEVDAKGRYLVTVGNVKRILDNDPLLRGCFGYDTFADREVVLRDLPWRLMATGRNIEDHDDTEVRYYMERMYNIVGTFKIKDAFDIAVRQNRFHPVRDYLHGLLWDGNPRVDSLLIDFLGAGDTEYTRAVTRKTLAAAVTRIFHPGCKFDYMLTLTGLEGKGKSTLFGKLANRLNDNRGWFNDSLLSIHNKDAFELLQGSWIVEMAELAGIKKAEVENIKNFISKRVDTFRGAYDHRKHDHPRQCIFIGTTNRSDFLRSQNGNRRFWVVQTDIGKAILRATSDTDLNEYYVDQVWAEAMEIYQEGEQLFLPEHLEDLAREVQEDHTESDDRFGMIENYLNLKVPETWYKKTIFERRSIVGGDLSEGEKAVRHRSYICVAEIWCELMGGTLKDMNGFNTRHLHDVMRKMPGWEKKTWKRDFSIYGRQITYKKKA